MGARDIEKYYSGMQTIQTEIRSHNDVDYRFYFQKHDDGCPPAWVCPITHEVMRDPVSDANGNSYERAAIVYLTPQNGKLRGGGCCRFMPITGKPVRCRYCIRRTNPLDRR